jgi:hypothetical protein
MILNGQLPDRMNLAFHGIFAAGCIAGLLVRGRRSQEALGVGFAVALVAYIGMLFTRLR